MLSMAILQQAGQLSPHIPMGSSQPALLHRPQGRTDLLLKLPAAGSPAYVFMGILSTSLGNAPYAWELSGKGGLEGMSVVFVDRSRSKVFFRWGVTLGSLIKSHRNLLRQTSAERKFSGRLWRWFQDQSEDSRTWLEIFTCKMTRHMS